MSDEDSYMYGFSSDTVVDACGKSTLSSFSHVSNGSGFVVNMDKYKIANEQLPSNKWIADCANYKLPAAADALYHCGPGYNFISPIADNTFCNIPEGTKAVYLKDLEFGLRFPLNEEVKIF